MVPPYQPHGHIHHHYQGQTQSHQAQTKRQQHQQQHQQVTGHAHHTHAKLINEVDQLSAKAFCTTVATNATYQAYHKRVYHIAMLQAVYIASRRRITHLDDATERVKRQVAVQEEKCRAAEARLGKALGVLNQLSGLFEFEVVSFLRGLSSSCWS